MEQVIDRYDFLMEYISSWPDWKINALYLDESDLELKKLIIQYRESKSKTVMGGRLLQY